MSIENGGKIYFVSSQIFQIFTVNVIEGRIKTYRPHRNRYLIFGRSSTIKSKQIIYHTIGTEQTGANVRN